MYEAYIVTATIVKVGDPISIPPPRFSIIIAVYNDWEPLARCLESLAQQKNAPEFEAIVVDDGSDRVAPESILRWSQSYPLIIIRQPHAYVSAARNRGINISKGSIVVFVDADCRFQTDSLAALNATVSDSPHHDYFQLHLIGDCSTLVGSAEELRLITLQNHTLQPNGCIRYLNTAGFAIRRKQIDLEKGLFDPTLVRAEDTSLLASLIEAGHLPFFATHATIQHAIPLSFVECLRKDIQSARLETKAYDAISSRGVRIQMSHRERLRLLREMWKISRQHCIGRLAWFVLVIRQGLRLSIFVAHRATRKWSKPNP